MEKYLTEYYEQAGERARLGVEPLPLNAEFTKQLCELCKNPPVGSESELLHLLKDRINPGVDESSAIKAEFLYDIATGKTVSPVVDKTLAVKLLGTMKGGFNVGYLIKLLEDESMAAEAETALEHTLLIYNAFDEIAALADKGNTFALNLIKKWADATWFTSKESFPQKVTLTVFKVAGETNTDDFSPAPDAWSRPDIPLHALAMYKMSRDDLKADVEGVKGPVSTIEALKSKGFPLIFVGDVVGTGSSRKSAANSLLWHIGHDIEGVPNKRAGGVVVGGKIAPIFYNTLEDSGALPLEADVSKLNRGDVVDLNVYDGTITNHETGEVLCSFSLKTPTLLDEVRAGGRIPLIIGKDLTDRARAYLKLGPTDVFAKASEVKASGGFTRAQKIVGRACGVEGIRPGQYCQPVITTVGSQDTTGPMTRDELVDLACLKFTAPMVMQSFCHTAAYPKSVDVKTHSTLPKFIHSRGGVALNPGDGVIHTWLNRMCLPDTVGTGGDSHTRMPLGISFAAGSGLVAFAAATGIMPLDMPESVLVRFKGKRKAGITLRDLVHAIPYFAIKKGLLTVEKKGKKNVFSGKIIEIEGLENLSVEHAFELADASAERSAAACAIKLSQASVEKYLKSNIALLRKMAEDGYESKEALLKRADAMQKWLENPSLIEADKDCSYAEVLEIDLDEIKEPILCAPNDPDDARLLSEVANTKIDEVFIGSCMTNIGHYRAAAEIFRDLKSEAKVRLWMAPPTRMDRQELSDEGLLSILGKAGARIEIPGCSLCMGNQARVADNATVISTSTRNFPNRLGNGANVFLGSAELASVTAKLGRLPSVEEYFDNTRCLDGKENSIYSLLDFSKSE
ncbi:bifunctional aconitate hydratase 2/2-methylisocitrate dehydratase [Succinivibrio dextrinosolvens]|uniref:bifunctional aconitate hydratase 2/2-methylisocitrate dehydratase n=1 Tax=Succinivibrio dextrinosolvens TaxID=83771 RepID=UPI0004E1D2C5|nr:bifunctional aconitate hydratase 2/2-methylisocitrate dehydratase [Succinivibrio dextrinosolvens]MBE6421961.1 bifunctional aconitate hydratase 2/2-methylisocitrate dehydratase [Succinivibrio dextrinosolvens]